MFLIDWVEANILMAATVLVLFGIPLVIGIIVFSKKGNENKEENNLQ